MKLGIAIEDTWSFLHEIYADLSQHHDTTVFERRHIAAPALYDRVNEYIFRRDLQGFMRRNDVVFFEWASGLLATASRLPKTCGIVTRLHRYELYDWADKVDWDSVDAIILVSQAKRQEFVTRFPAQTHKVVVIPEAVSLRRFDFKPKPFTGNIGILCHLRPRKRVYELILAFSELVCKQEGLHLHIGGGQRPRNVDYYAAIHKLVDDLDLSQHVTFYEHVDQPEAWYNRVDVFISNSYSEGLQVSPMEAIASGCYCLSHHWDGADELLPTDNLYYTDNQLQEKILEYCDLPEAERQRRIADLRTFVVRQFDVDVTKVQVRQVIESVGAAARVKIDKDR
jgi:glycosyltransferase involved in cell wall biosynthesis